MGDSVVISTLLLTVLLTIGQAFFIRASVKDRTETVRLSAQQEADVLLGQLKQYFTDRSYQVTSIDGDRNLVNLVGTVRPSVFLAVFLSGLAVIGTLCFVLVLNVVAPAQSTIWWACMAFSPLAGLFYWKGSDRSETVSFLLEPNTAVNTTEPTNQVSIIKVQAHRDEIESLKQSLNLVLLD